MTTLEKKVRHRETKVSADQMSQLVDLLSLPQNKTVLTMKPHPLKVGELLKLWESIGKSLNLLSGPKKCAEDWRRYFVEWKSRTRKKARDFKAEAQATGGGPNSAKPLTELEEKLMGLLGWVSVQGCQDMPEEQEIQEKPEEDENFPRVLQINENGELLSTLKNFHVQPEDIIIEELEVPREDVEVPDEINIPSKRKKSNVQSKRKRNLEKKRRYTSSVSVLNDSAKIFADGADKISSAFMHFGDAIFALAGAISASTASKTVANSI